MLDTETDENVKNLQKVVRNQVNNNNNQNGSLARIRNNYSASDARHFASFQIPAVVFGPRGLNLHKPNEYAVIDSFNDYIESVKIFASNY
jgi:acetylornithine deacetylase/succinyl-diaminopimelate desuccinylase-like protein